VKPDKLYQELKDIAEKIGLCVSEQNFRHTGIRVKSGFCIVKDRQCCIIDKHLKVTKKLEVLAECISDNALESALEGMFVIPAVREYLETFHVSKSMQQKAPAQGSTVQDAPREEP
jgi:hypothetical protein